MQRTTQQQTFIDTVIAARHDGGGKHFCLRARAGTGKTSTVLELVDDYVAKFGDDEVTLTAFNKKAADELKEKLVKRGHKDTRKVAAATVHSLAFSLVRFAFKPRKIGTDAQYKVFDLIDAQNAPVYQEHKATIANLVHFAKIEGFGFFDDAQIGDTHAWYNLAEHYAINGFDNTNVLDDVIAAAQNIYRLSLAQTDIIDFDDMILFPLVKNLKVKFQKRLLIVDEAQDTGRARQALITKFVAPNGILIVVGDDRQGIYGFAGAQADALEQLIAQFDMQVLPLTICWRCPVNVIKLAQKSVPDIEWAPGAAEGEVVRVEALPEEILPTDAILCRNTAPLIEQAYALLRRGIACKVEGREIGSGLLRLVNRWKITTIDEFLVKLEDYREREVQKALAKRKQDKAAEVGDRCDTLVHLCRVCLDRQENSLDDLRNFIDSIFADDVKGVATLCTYHRSKGREWKRVLLIEHGSRCPSKWAKQPWQQHQEANLAYVAFTRAMETLVFVN